MNAIILLVEDDPSARLGLSRVLERAGYRCDTAATGEDGIQALQSVPYDIVITDIRLPNCDGIDVLRAAMATPRPPAVLLLTGYGTLESAIQAIQLGAVNYLIKPCSPQMLIDGVGAALKRRTSTDQAEALTSLASNVAAIQRQLETLQGTQMPTNEHTITVGRLEIGRYPHETRYANTSVHLTPTEHALLRCLAEANTHVVAYSAILRRTHGYAATDLEAQVLLKSHVRNLRRKLNADIVHSVRNVGYRLKL